MQISRKNECGRSMLEVIGYMAVVLVFIVSVGRMVTSAYDDYKLSKASLQLGELAANITKAAAIDTNYTEVINSINQDAKCDSNHLIPSSFNVKRTCSGGKGPIIFHAFGGKTEIALDGNKFLIRFFGLTKEQCVELALKDWVNNKSVDLDSIIINTTNYWYWPVYSEGDSMAHRLPVTRAVVAGSGNSSGQCNDAGNNITWVFN